jgi:hypothetical protein
MFDKELLIKDFTGGQFVVTAGQASSLIILSVQVSQISERPSKLIIARDWMREIELLLRHSTRANLRISMNRGSEEKRSCHEMPRKSVLKSVLRLLLELICICGLFAPSREIVEVSA